MGRLISPSRFFLFKCLKLASIYIHTDALPTADGSRPWSVCNDAIDLPDDHPFSMLSTLKELLESGYQVLLYNGENDLSWCVWGVLLVASAPFCLSMFRGVGWPSVDRQRVLFFLPPFHQLDLSNGRTAISSGRRPIWTSWSGAGSATGRRPRGAMCREKVVKTSLLTHANLCMCIKVHVARPQRRVGRQAAAARGHRPR
jgi:hypothetical protein